MEDGENKNNGTGKVTEGSAETAALRYTFVEMLFALAIAEVAVVASGIVRADATIIEKLPVTAHLILATVLIAASWFGWSASRWRRELPKVETLLSLNFFGLLLDVFLVILYFILVRHAEISTDAPFTLDAPQAVPEAFWITWIFAVYVFWDFLSDVWKEERSRSLLASIGLTFASTACSIICVVLAYLATRVAEGIHSLWGVLFVDLALLSIVLLFRVLKVTLENRLYQTFPRLRQYAAFDKLRQGAGHEGRWVIVFFFVYVLGLVAASLMRCMSATG